MFHEQVFIDFIGTKGWIVFVRIFQSLCYLPGRRFGMGDFRRKVFQSEFVDYLKLRASWGINGNRDITNYAALSKMLAEKSLNTDLNGNPITIPTLEIIQWETKNLNGKRQELITWL